MIDKLNEKSIYFIRAKSPVLGISEQDFDNYLTTNELFKKFCSNVMDLEKSEEYDPITARYLEYKEKVKVFAEHMKEYYEEKGRELIVDTEKGKVKIGFSRIIENRIYVEWNNVYLRGFRVNMSDLCLIDALDYVPLDKSEGNGNIEIIRWNKRKAVKSIKVVHNQVESIMFVVDMVLNTFEEVQEDIQSPKDLNLGLLIETLI